MKINKMRPLEHNYTKVLKRLVLIPKTLYYYGKIPENRIKSVAIVGSRKNTSYGKEVAYTAAYEAAKAGAIVVSGLAYGIDSIAHRSALDAGGITIAVLGTPIDEIYPACHRGLAEEIVEKGGMVISEYGPGESGSNKKMIQARFLARNRIIAGLSDITLIAEAADRSGTLNTAAHSLDIGNDLMAVPGDITRFSSRGCNKLLSQGAIPYTEKDNLISLLFPERMKILTSEKCSDRDNSKIIEKYADSELERTILSEIIDGTQDGEKIIEKANISAREFGQAITLLEIKGAVKALGANKWMTIG